MLVSLCSQTFGCASVFVTAALSQRAALSQDPPGAFPDGPAEPLPISERHRCQVHARFQGTRGWGFGTLGLWQDKGATFGGHLGVLGPAVLSTWWLHFGLFSQIWQVVASSEKTNCAHAELLISSMVQRYNMLHGGAVHTTLPTTAITDEFLSTI